MNSSVDPVEVQAASEHSFAIDKELKKLESRFFNLFREEKNEILQKSNQEFQEVQVDVLFWLAELTLLQHKTKRYYESRLRDLEIQLNNTVAVTQENQKLRADIERLLESERNLINVKYNY